MNILLKITILVLLVYTPTLSFSQGNDNTVDVPLSSIRASYEKMKERKVYKHYADSLEKEVKALSDRIVYLNGKLDDQRKQYDALLKIENDKYKVLKKLIDVKKARFLMGMGGAINSGFDVIQLQIHGGIIFNQKRIVSLNIGMDNRQNLLLGSTFFTVF